MATHFARYKNVFLWLSVLDANLSLLVKFRWFSNSSFSKRRWTLTKYRGILDIYSSWKVHFWRFQTHLVILKRHFVWSRTAFLRWNCHNETAIGIDHILLKLVKFRWLAGGITKLYHFQILQKAAEMDVSRAVDTKNIQVCYLTLSEFRERFIRKTWKFREFCKKWQVCDNQKKTLLYGKFVRFHSFDVKYRQNSSLCGILKNIHFFVKSLCIKNTYLNWFHIDCHRNVCGITRFLYLRYTPHVSFRTTNADCRWNEIIGVAKFRS